MSEITSQLGLSNFTIPCSSRIIHMGNRSSQAYYIHSIDHVPSSVFAYPFSEFPGPDWYSGITDTSYLVSWIKFCRVVDLSFAETVTCLLSPPVSGLYTSLYRRTFPGAGVQPTTKLSVVSSVILKFRGAPLTTKNIQISFVNTSF